MRTWIILLCIVVPTALLAQKVSSKKDRICLGENVLIKGNWDLDMAIAQNLTYTDQPGYAGDYDAQSWDFPFGIKLVAPGEKGGKANHIENQDKNIVIWLNIQPTDNQLDCAQLLDNGWGTVSNVTCMPAEYSRTNFNADSTLTFNLDMAGNSVNDRYNHHKGILICKKNALSIRMDCFLTDEGLKNFDSKYLKDIEKMFRFKELEAQK